MQGGSSSRSTKRDFVNLERNRREKMSEYYTLLQSMVPNLFPRATRTRVVEETISYIKGLQEVAMALEMEKAARQQPAIAFPLQIDTNANTSVNITFSGNTVFYGLNVASRPGIGTQVLQVFDKHNAQVLAATVVSHGLRLSMTVTVSCSLDDGVVERIKEELMNI